MRVVSHAIELFVRQFCQLVLSLRFVTFQLLMLEVVPHFLVGIPVWGVSGKVEDMEAWLAIDEAQSLL